MTTEIPESKVLRIIMGVFAFVVLLAVLITVLKDDESDYVDERTVEYREERGQIQDNNEEK